MSNKVTYVSISLIAIAILGAALAVSGCTGGGAAPSSSTTATVAATPAESTGSTGSGASTSGDSSVDPWTKAFKHDQLHWYTYKKVGGSEVKIEYSPETYNGQAATKITTTIEGKKTAESFYDFANQQFLGGKYFLGGMDTDMTKSDFDSMANDEYFTLDDPEDYTYKLKSATESVTTAAGTFQATKYTTDSGYESFWVSTSAPLPVKYYNKVTDFTWEPTAWG